MQACLARGASAAERRIGVARSEASFPAVAFHFGKIWLVGAGVLSQVSDGHTTNAYLGDNLADPVQSIILSDVAVCHGWTVGQRFRLEAVSAGHITLTVGSRETRRTARTKGVATRNNAGLLL